MSLSQDLDELRRKYAAVASQEQVALMERGDAEIAARRFLEKAVRTGDKAPDFTLPGVSGETVTLSQALKAGPVVLVFYRGGWCPYCSLTLRAYQKELPRIQKAGGQVLAISPQNPDNTLSTEEKNQLSFPVLSDVKNEASKAYGILFDLPGYLLSLYKEWKTDLSIINAAGAWSLPVPAIYVIGKDGRILAHHVDLDYRTRMEPDDAIRALNTARLLI